MEGVGPEVCAPPCEACIPYPPGDPNIPTAGRCARGNPTACPIDGLTPKPMCVRNGPITETCGPEDDNCNGPPFDVADAMLGRPCTMPQLPPSSGCGATPGANWVTGSYTGHRALGGHRVCDPVSGTVACVAIPGIDFCNAVNCRLFCGAEPCRSFRRTDESNTAVTVSGTGQPAFWNDARILFATGDPDVFTPVDWNMDGIHQGCPGFCPEQTCNMGGSCGAGLECAIADPALNTCVERRGCPAEQSPVVCWNHISESNNNVGGCR